MKNAFKEPLAKIYSVNSNWEPEGFKNGWKHDGKWKAENEK